MKTLFYEDNAGGIHAVVERDDGTVENVLSGFHFSCWDLPELICAARCGFDDAEPYDPDAFSGLAQEAAAREIIDMDSLIAEIERNTVTIYIDAMGLAGKKLFQIKEGA